MEDPRTSAESSLDEWAAYHSDTRLRLAKLTPADTIKGLFLKGYLDIYRKEGGDGFYKQCMAMLGEKYIVDLFNYPYSGVMRIGVLGAELMAMKLGGIRAYLRAMGRLATAGYFDSILGKSFLALVHPSPRSMLSMMPAAIH
ncbi:MAG: TIGR02265 family protein, partial [Myxococcaceae bacterium]